MRKGLLILVAAALLGVVAGCSSGANPAKQGSVEPAEDVFTRVGGWIAFRNGFEIVAVDPANPKTPSCSDPRWTTTPSHGHPMGPSSSFDPVKRKTAFRFRCRVCSSFTRTARGPRLCARFPSAPSAAPGRTRRARFSRVPRNVGILLARWDRGRLWGSTQALDPSSSTRTEAKPRPLGDRCDVLVNGLVVDTCGEGADAAAWSPDGSKILWLDFIEGGGRNKPYEGTAPSGSVATGLSCRPSTRTAPAAIGGCAPARGWCVQLCLVARRLAAGLRGGLSDLRDQRRRIGPATGHPRRGQPLARVVLRRIADRLRARRDAFHHGPGRDRHAERAA